VSERNPPMMINVINQSQEIKRACSVPGLDVGVLSSDICWLPYSRPQQASSKPGNSTKAVENPYELVTRDIRQKEFIEKGILIEISMQKRGSEEWKACVQRHSVSILFSPSHPAETCREVFFGNTTPVKQCALINCVWVKRAVGRENCV
jgi:hypothetical protein